MNIVISLKVYLNWTPGQTMDNFVAAGSCYGCNARRTIDDPTPVMVTVTSDQAGAATGGVFCRAIQYAG